MKEIKDIITAYQSLDLNDNKVAMATVIYVAGSSYRRAGARMLVQDNGVYIGGISGGCLEGDALKKANHCMVRNRTEVVRYDTSQEGEGAIGAGLGCNGIIDVLLTPIQDGDSNNPIEILTSCVNDRHLNCLITVISSSNDKFIAGEMYKYVDDSELFPATVLADIQTALVTGKSIVKDYEDLSVFIEILLPSLTVVLFGSSYDVYPMLKIGNELGWDMSVVCNTNKVTKSMKTLCKNIYAKDTEIPYDDFTAFVLMAHDYKTDKDGLQMALQLDVPYVGMLGPLKRRNRALEELASEGVYITAAQKQRLFNPIGLDIGSITPEEIALAVLAEIRACFSGRNGRFLREKAGTIHERV